MAEKDVSNLIIESATKYFSKYGFHKTTMDEIARHIHKAKGVLYYYFNSKEDLFNEVLKRELRNAKDELSKITNSDNDYLTVINLYFLTRLNLLSTAVNYHETLKADFFEKYHFVKDVRDDFSEFEYKQLYKIFKKGNQEGQLNIKNMRSTVNIVLMILNSVELPLYLQNRYSEYESAIEEMVTMITNSLRHYKK